MKLRQQVEKGRKAEEILNKQCLENEENIRLRLIY